MSKPGKAAVHVSDDAIEEALSDHHLDEVAEMIEWAQADSPPSESPIRDSPAGSSRRLIRSVRGVRGN